MFKMLEYIIITKPAEKEDKNTIKLMNNQILQAGLKKDIEPLDDYIRHMEGDLRSIEVNGKHLFNTHYYFVEGGIRILHYWKDRPLEFMPLKPASNIEGSMHYYTRAVDILYQFDKKLKEIFPEAKYKLIVKHHDCCLLQPRIVFKKNYTKPIRDAFPEFRLEEKIDETEYEPRIIPLGFKYEEDYKEHLNGYYDCRRCDPMPCWGDYVEETPKQDPTDEFCDQKVPRRTKGSPRAHCFGTRTRELPEGTVTYELGYWKLSSEELLDRIKNPKKDDILNALIDERRMRVYTGRITISMEGGPIKFQELEGILQSDKGPIAELIKLEEKGLIKEYHANH
jgi:hypothetical protein